MKYAGPRLQQMIHNLLPEEDALDDPDDDDDADPTLPGDLWFRRRRPVGMNTCMRGWAAGGVVYFQAFVPLPA